MPIEAPERMEPPTEKLPKTPRRTKPFYDKLRKAVQEGWTKHSFDSIADACEQLGVSANFVESALKGLRSSHSEKTSKEIRDRVICLMFQTGEWTSRRLAELFGLSHQYVNEILSARGARQASILAGTKATG